MSSRGVIDFRTNFQLWERLYHGLRISEFIKWMTKSGNVSLDQRSRTEKKKFKRSENCFLCVADIFRKCSTVKLRSDKVARTDTKLYDSHTTEKNWSKLHFAHWEFFPNSISVGFFFENFLEMFETHEKQFSPRYSKKTHFFSFVNSGLKKNMIVEE